MSLSMNFLFSKKNGTKLTHMRLLGSKLIFVQMRMMFSLNRKFSFLYYAFKKYTININWGQLTPICNIMLCVILYSSVVRFYVFLITS